MSANYERQPGSTWLMIWTAGGELPLDLQMACEDLSI